MKYKRMPAPNLANLWGTLQKSCKAQDAKKTDTKKAVKRAVEIAEAQAEGSSKKAKTDASEQLPVPDGHWLENISFEIF